MFRLPIMKFIPIVVLAGLAACSDRAYFVEPTAQSQSHSLTGFVPYKP